MLNFDGTATIDKSLGGGLARGLARSKTAFDGSYDVSVLADAEEGSQGGRKGFIGVQMGLLASNPVITGVGDRLRSVESPIWSRRGRRKGKETDRWGQCGSETGREGKHRWAGPYCQSERR